MRKSYIQQLFIFFFLIVIALPVILPFFHTGYFPTHDGEWAIVRLGDMFRSLRDHQFPVRYSGNLNFGYGYPLFNFVYPAPYYIGIIFHFMKFSFVDSIKLLFMLSVSLSSITMYLASYELWRNKVAAVISSLFYIYFPYRIVDLYVRGSLGESLSFALFPIIFFSVSKIIANSNSKNYAILGSINYALLIMTHNIMAVLFTPLLFIFIGWKMYFAKRKNYLNILLFILLSYALSAFFWIPALLEKNNILLSKIPIADRSLYFVNFNHLITPIWGYGTPGQPGGFSYQIGLPQIAVLTIAIFLFIYFYSIKKKVFQQPYFQLAAVFAATTIFLTILMFSFTASIWRVTPLLKEINYPWTLLAPIGFMLSLLSGFLWLQNKFIKYTVLILCPLAVILVLPNAKPSGFIDKGDQFYLTNEATTTSSQELMPLWVRTKPFRRYDKKVEIVEGKGTIQNMFFNSKIINFELDLKSKSIARINTIYYPGWAVSVDGKNIPVVYNNDLGVMDITSLPGRHLVNARFSETPLRLLSDFISLAALLSVFIIILPYKYIKKLYARF